MYTKLTLNAFEVIVIKFFVLHAKYTPTLPIDVPSRISRLVNRLFGFLYPM